MANNTYGTVKQALFNPQLDADVYYNYKPSRSSDDTAYGGFRKIDNVQDILVNSTTETEILGSDNRLPGMYTLKLPVSIFGQAGIYTVYITPKEIKCTIKDVGALGAYPDIRGIVVDTNEIPYDYQSLFSNDNLTGYRIEYFDYAANNSGLMRQEYYRIITSNGRCQALSQNLTSANTNATGYTYNANGSLSFLTVTPSTAPTFKSNAMPFIGKPSQTIVIKNTKFDPVCLELEVSEHDIETISVMLEGEQIRNLENGRVTTYNFDGEIYKQFEYSTVKDNYHNKEIAEAKLDKSDNIDRSLDLDTIKNS